MDRNPERIVRLEADAVVVLDQRRLPDEEVELRCASAAEVADAIRTLAVRGAPAIGVAAAYGLALAASRGEDLDAAYDVLASSRPTAVNLRWALDELRDDPTPERARALHDDEVARCRRMGSTLRHSLPTWSARCSTHCNTGAARDRRLRLGARGGARRVGGGPRRARLGRRDAPAPPG